VEEVVAGQEGGCVSLEVGPFELSDGYGRVSRVRLHAQKTKLYHEIESWSIAHFARRIACLIVVDGFCFCGGYNIIVIDIALYPTLTSLAVVAPRLEAP
jgi:hypothetical protein